MWFPFAWGKAAEFFGHDKVIQSGMSVFDILSHEHWDEIIWYKRHFLLRNYVFLLHRFRVWIQLQFRKLSMSLDSIAGYKTEANFCKQSLINSMKSMAATPRFSIHKFDPALKTDRILPNIFILLKSKANSLAQT